MTVIKPFHSAIATKDDKIFKGLTEINILTDIDFRSLWTKDINQNTRENIWKYLQTLIVIGKKVVGDDEEIDTLLKKFNTAGSAGSAGSAGTVGTVGSAGTVGSVGSAGSAGTVGTVGSAGTA